MNTKFIYILVFQLSLMMGLTVFAKDQNLLDLDWEDLVPNDYVFENPLDSLSDEEYEALTDDSEKAQELMNEIRQLMDFAPVVEDLNGKTVRLSGYAVPLDFEAQQVKEFLLVPYFGACIHVPPPPGNQTVYVKSDQGLEMEGLWDPVSVTGTLQTVHTNSELAASGYTISADEVGPYEEVVAD